MAMWITDPIVSFTVLVKDLRTEQIIKEKVFYGTDSEEAQAWMDSEMDIWGEDRGYKMVTKFLE